MGGTNLPKSLLVKGSTFDSWLLVSLELACTLSRERKLGPRKALVAGRDFNFTFGQNCIYSYAFLETMAALISPAPFSAILRDDR